MASPEAEKNGALGQTNGERKGYALCERELAQVDMVLWRGDQVDELSDFRLERRLNSGISYRCTSPRAGP